MLILHGEKDERVPLNQALGFHRALRAHDVPVELVVYPPTTCRSSSSYIRTSRTALASATIKSTF